MAISPVFTTGWSVCRVLHLEIALHLFYVIYRIVTKTIIKGAKHIFQYNIKRLIQSMPQFLNYKILSISIIYSEHHILQKSDAFILTFRNIRLVYIVFFGYVMAYNIENLHYLYRGLCNGFGTVS